MTVDGGEYEAARGGAVTSSTTALARVSMTEGGRGGPAFVSGGLRSAAGGGSAAAVPPGP